MSQQRLADTLGLRFQQIQKYEYGRNRVSASRLFHSALILGVAVSYFFEGLDDPPEEGADPQEEAVRAFLRTDEGMELVKLFSRVPSARLRRQMLQLVRAIATPEPEIPA